MNATDIVQLWLANDEALYLTSLELVEEYATEDDIQNTLRDFVREVIRADHERGDGGLGGDLSTAAWLDVNWAEVVADIREE